MLHHYDLVVFGDRKFAGQKSLYHVFIAFSDLVEGVNVEDSEDTWVSLNVSIYSTELLIIGRNANLSFEFVSR